MRLSLAASFVALIFVLGALVGATPAHAADVSWSGELSRDAATWERPSCTGVTSNVEWWQARAFSVDVTGTYVIEMTESAPIGTASTPDGFFVLYENSFDPAVPLSNCVSSNDDAGGSGFDPYIAETLTAGVEYTLVTTQCCDGVTDGDAMSYTNRISGPGQVALLGHPSSTTVSASSSAIQAGAPLTMTAQVSSVIPLADRSGTVNFLVGGESVGSAAVNAQTGTATLSGITLPAGALELSAVYSGNGETRTSTSSAIPVTVDKAISVVQFEVLPASIAIGNQLTFTATVAGYNPTGQIEILSGGVRILSVPLVAGTAQATVPAVTVGTSSISAAYTGDINNLPGASAASALTVTKAPTTTVLAAAHPALTVGDGTTLTATVAGFTPTGVVEFFDGNRSLGTSRIVGNTATLSVNSLSVGSRSLSAVYPGDQNNETSTSAAGTVTVNPVPPSATGLASTGGGDPAPVAMMGVLMMVGGLALLGIRRIGSRSSRGQSILNG